MNSSNKNNTGIVEQLIKEAEKGNASQLNAILDTNDFSKKTVDEAFRICIRNYKNQNEDYLRSIKLFLRIAEDINYRNEKENNTTILMEAIWQGQATPAGLIIDCYSHFDGEQKLNVNVLDNTKENCLFKLIKTPNFTSEEYRIELFRAIIKENLDIHHENVDGYTVLSYALLTGNSAIVEELINLGAKKSHVIHSTGDNNLHCAVKGRNPLCVSLMAVNNQAGFNTDRISKNKNMETPYDIAVKMDLGKIIQILSEVKSLSMLQLLDEFKNKNFPEVSKLLNEFRENHKVHNISLDWNTLLVEYMNSIFLKKLNNISEKSNSNVALVINFFKKFSAFFSAYSSYKKFNENENQLICLNNAFFHYKLNDYKSIINILVENFNKTIEKPDWLIYVNSAFLLVDVCLLMRQSRIANKILIKLEEFINYSKSIQLNSNSSVGEYLNSQEILNKFTSYDETYCALHLYKAYKFLIEDKLEDSRRSLKEYKRIYLTSKYKDANESFPIFSTLKNFYHFLKIEIDYNQNSVFKCYKHLNSLYNQTITKTNDNHECLMFYYNSLGIVNLKQKKYKLAEFFFNQCISLIKSYPHKTGTLHHVINSLPKAKFNLALCYFYQKRYESAYVLLKELQTIKGLSYNPFFLYRIGLCCLEIQLQGMKKKSSEYGNEFMEKYLVNETSEEGSEVTNSFKRILLRNRNCRKSDGRDHLSEAIKSFKQAAILLKQNFYLKKELQELTNLFNVHDDNPEEANRPMFKSYTQLLTSIYINLLFCFTLKEEWNEVLFYGAEFEKTEIFNRDTSYIIDNYIIEALLALNKIPQVLEILKKNMISNNFSYNSIDVKGTFFNKTNNELYHELNYKLALYINIIKMNFINNNLVEVEKGIISITNLMNISLTMQNGVVCHSDLPGYFINLLVYYYIAKENYDTAIKILKKRRLPSLFVQPVQPTQGKISSILK